MGFRFRRSVKLVPGLRLNIGKRGLSLSAGVRGARVTVGSRGITRTIGLPDTGLSFTSRQGYGSRRRRIASPAPAAPVIPARPLIDASRLGIVAQPLSSMAGRARPVLLTLGFLVFFAAMFGPELYLPGGLLAGLILMLMGVVCRSRARLERAEDERVQDLAYAELARREQEARQHLERRKQLIARAVTEVFESDRRRVRRATNAANHGSRATARDGRVPLR